jgi:hypothetical protein
MKEGIPKDIYIHNKTAVFTITKTWKKPKCPKK